MLIRVSKQGLVGTRYARSRSRYTHVLARARGSLNEFVLNNSYKKARCMNAYYTIRIKNCMNWYKNHTLYEFVLYNMYNFICMNSYKKKICIRVGI